MTKDEFVKRVSERANLSREDATAAVDAFLDSITDVLKDGEDVNFTGFGKFTTKRRAARQSVNPRNPTERVHIAGTIVPKFSAGIALKQASDLRERVVELKEEGDDFRAGIKEPLDELRSISG